VNSSILPTTQHSGEPAFSNSMVGQNGRQNGWTATASTVGVKSGKAKGITRKRLTVYLPLELLERARNTVYWSKGLTLAGLIEQALADSLNRKEQVNGKIFPQRLEELKGGRPRRLVF
jgi:hypothetical protein